MADKKITDVENTSSCETIFVKNNGGLKQITKDLLLSGYVKSDSVYTKSEIDNKLGLIDTIYNLI